MTIPCNVLVACSIAHVGKTPNFSIVSLSSRWKWYKVSFWGQNKSLWCSRLVIVTVVFNGIMANVLQMNKCHFNWDLLVHFANIKIMQLNFFSINVYVCTEPNKVFVKFQLILTLPSNEKLKLYIMMKNKSDFCAICMCRIKVYYCSQTHL